MQINDCKTKIKCDMPGCKNFAIYSIQNHIEKKSALGLCEQCAKQIYALLGNEFIPKNIPAPFKNQKKIGAKR